MAPCRRLISFRPEEFKRDEMVRLETDDANRESRVRVEAVKAGVSVEAKGVGGVGGDRFGSSSKRDKVEAVGESKDDRKRRFRRRTSQGDRLRCGEALVAAVGRPSPWPDCE